MINITNNEESKRIDDILINDYKIPENILMENAARSILEKLDLENNKSFLIIAGPGNNGGDGLALARLLHMKNKKVKIICSENKTIHYEICKNIGIPFITDLEPSDILIDAIFGVGIIGEVSEPYKSLIENINRNKSKFSKIISIDLPSPKLKTDKVLMLSSYKEQLLYKDIEVELCNIGVNPTLFKNVSNKFLVDKDYIESILIKKNVFSNKGDFGKVGIYAKNGAALLSVKASIRSGAGYTFLLSDAVTINGNLIYNPECINKKIENDIQCDVYAIGPSFGVNNITKEIILKYIDKNLVLDADALTIIAQNKEMIKLLNKECIISPHMLEFSRLTGENIESLTLSPFESLKRFKTHFKGIVLLKGKNNIIYDGKNYYIINIGNSKMANAGMGDTLTGMIASYKAQGYSSLNATILAVYKQAELGMRLSNKYEVINPTTLLNEM
ncbi:NAD(P)H-hydrate epimerase [Oceanivirga salmonicida]|uniref:NAD(P)H-hydrate epimerase n=1 Tax=Oceanivirga salmonicida TaxID=1769291 RepID=UPI0012E1D37F|nr:NAD(P)H-hydrate epimerase [Oceanivirga salmonicida]